MDRLTEWRGKHAAVWNNHENYIDRLAQYEDTGLTPAEVAALKAERGDWEFDRTCPNCGADIDVAWMACPYCGQHVPGLL